MLVALVLGTTGYQALWGDHSPPDIRLEIESVSRRSGGYLVLFTALNRGGSPAEGVVVEARAGDGAAAERSQTTLDYLPAHSRRRGGLYVSTDPSQPGFSLRALGYERP